jgi:hypothetical protein
MSAAKGGQFRKYAKVGTADDWGLDADEGRTKWYATCDTHGTLVGGPTKHSVSKNSTDEFCDDCRESK